MVFTVELIELTRARVLGAGFLLFLAYAVYRLYIHPNYLSTIANIPGPPTDNLITGNLQAIFKAEPGILHNKWIEEHGPVLQYRGFLGDNRLYVSDPRALNHILLQKCYDWPKPPQTRGQLARILGKGILFAEGDDHKRQRRILNGPFTQAQVNSYLPIFQEQTDKLRDRMISVVAGDKVNEEDRRGDHTVVDVADWLSRTTLDIIGLAGFDYSFGALDEDENELAGVIKAMLKPREIKIWMIILQGLAVYFPFLLKLPTKAAKAINRMMYIIEGEGQKMMDERRRLAETGELEDKKDLMSLVVKANLQAASKKDKLGDHEIQGQVTTFILAGHETSSTTLLWILAYMSQFPDIQKKLREEIVAAKDAAAAEGRSHLTVEEINQLSYTDAVVRETLRHAPPVFLTIRGAAKDDVIPLSEPITGRDGTKIHAIQVKRGQQAMIAIKSMNYQEQLFGADAAEYRPERWTDGSLDERLAATKGFTAWSGTLSFLGGPRGCIGYRFALLEIKTILVMLMSEFEFLERDVEGTPLTARSNIVTRPLVAGEEDQGSRLPLRVKHVGRAG